MKRPALADYFTLANVIAGFLSILQSELLWGAVFILIGAVMDIFDGWVARWQNKPSAIGLQLDSLADMITFGVAPAILFYKMMPPSLLFNIMACLIPAVSAWRLANFNLLPASDSFRGLPTPSNAAWYAGLALWWEQGSYLPEWTTQPYLHLIISIVLTSLLVSTIQVPAFKTKGLWKQHVWYPILIFAGGASAVIFIGPAYILTALFLAGICLLPFLSLGNKLAINAN